MMMMIERPGNQEDREIPESITVVGVASSARGEKTKAEAGGAYR